MATIAADGPGPLLPLVRRLEAAGFRAWPAERVGYDGSWQWRTTPGHPSKRLNCVVPLDPADSGDMRTRVRAAVDRFRTMGLKPTIRQTPLFPPGLADLLRADGWTPGYRTIVMAADLDRVDCGHGLDHLPTHDIERFSEACIRIDEARDTTAAVLGRIIGAIEPVAGLFLMEDKDGPQAVGICVQDNDLAGLQQIVVARQSRRQGLGLEIVSAALRWARLRGARKAWLQVLADNVAARSLYARIGFLDVYDYCYWTEAD
jgi:GNAT superfamily N-acetyltransferase